MKYFSEVVVVDAPRRKIELQKKITNLNSHIKITLFCRRLFAIQEWQELILQSGLGV
jgi:hypothetical protein